MASSPAAVCDQSRQLWSRRGACVHALLVKLSHPENSRNLADILIIAAKAKPANVPLANATVQPTEATTTIGADTRAATTSSDDKAKPTSRSETERFER